MEKIVVGNFEELAPEHRGWVWGHFMDPNTVMHSNNFEIKWSRLKKGDFKDTVGTNETAKTLHITLEGKFEIYFPNEKRKVTTNKTGDFIFYDHGTTHTWKALTDCFCIIIRWPSLPNDQKVK